MSEDELWGYLEGFFAWDSGSRDSGISDHRKREEVIQLIDSMTENDLRLFLSRRVRGAYLSEEALSQRYGIEDVFNFYRWFDEDLRSTLRS